MRGRSSAASTEGSRRELAVALTVISIGSSPTSQGRTGNATSAHALKASNRRLHSYAKAGFLKADPAVVRYYQPDFRDPSDIASAGGPKPLPFQLVLRRVGREQEQAMSAGEVKRLVRSLYGMYAMNFRPEDMRPTYATLDRYPPDNAVVKLISPLE